MSKQAKSSGSDEFLKAVALAMKAAAKEARRVAKMHGTKVWYIKDGKLVGEKP